MNKRLWIVFAFLVLAALGGLVIWKKSDDKPVDVSTYDGSKLITSADVGDGQIPDHYKGKIDSKVVVIMYEDYACIHCNEFDPTAKKIADNYKDQVLFIYRNFSLGYPNSTVSESAAEAAYLVGGDKAYWTMHHLLFSEEKWTSTAIGSDERKSLLTGYAKEAELDVDKFLQAVSDYTSNGIQTKMSRDKSLGIKAGVDVTPTWFINGAKIDGVADSTVRAAIEAALQK